jgi:hypothetical protein
MPDQAPEQIQLQSFEHPATGPAFAQIEPEFGGAPHLAVQPARGGAAMRWALAEARKLFANHPELGKFLQGIGDDGQPKASASPTSTSTGPSTTGPELTGPPPAGPNVPPQPSGPGPSPATAPRPGA